MQDKRFRHSGRPYCRCAIGFPAALVLLALAGCTGDVPIPFLNLPTIPEPAAGPPPEFPTVAAPAEDIENKYPKLNEAEQKKMEEQLNKLATEREAAVKRRILRDN